MLFEHKDKAPVNKSAKSLNTSHLSKEFNSPCRGTVEMEEENSASDSRTETAQPAESRKFLWILLWS